jgi:hypothetical protein
MGLLAEDSMAGHGSLVLASQPQVIHLVPPAPTMDIVVPSTAIGVVAAEQAHHTDSDATVARDSPQPQQQGPRYLRTPWRTRMKSWPPPSLRAVRLWSWQRRSTEQNDNKVWYEAMTGGLWNGREEPYQDAVSQYRNIFEVRALECCARGACGNVMLGDILIPPHSFDGLYLDESQEPHSTQVCFYCKASLFVNEQVRIPTIRNASGNVCYRGSICCTEGRCKPTTPALDEFADLKRWWFACGSDTDGQLGKVLRKNARYINNAFQMASQKLTQRRQPGSWNPSVIIEGRVSHHIGSLLPAQGETPVFGQVFVHDPSMTDAQVIQTRTAQLYLPQKVSAAEERHLQTILLSLHRSLQARNRYVHDFCLAAELHRSNMQHCSIIINPNARPSGAHERTYNAPGNGVQVDRHLPSQFHEVCILVSDEHVQDWSIVMQLRGGPLQTIPDGHRSFDPLHYVLLYPMGDDGWHTELYQDYPSRRWPVKLTTLQFYKAKIHWRVQNLNNNCLLMAGRLFQEYVCTAFVKVENQRLRWLRFNQKAIRADMYKNIVDHVAQLCHLPTSQRFATNCGTPVILPASFIGSPRDLNQRYMDAMAIVRAKGHPSFFITFTCNSGWPELQESLGPAQTAADRPDIVARVFHAKLQQLHQDLTGTCIFGPVVGSLCTVEFQKRGLPHAHILIILSERSQLITGNLALCYH